MILLWERRSGHASSHGAVISSVICFTYYKRRLQIALKFGSRSKTDHFQVNTGDRRLAEQVCYSNRVLKTFL